MDYIIKISQIKLIGGQKYQYIKIEFNMGKKKKQACLGQEIKK